ncbi:MAG: hypothetical protein NXH82_07660 [Rhodobacteraceae bacterium]|nr:hypothetical protein [Paracoccaceae bacterium]
MREKIIGYPTKIGTCCYCGTRAALVLKGQRQHALACGSCGAPLSNLKKLPRPQEPPRPGIDHTRSAPPAGHRPHPARKPRAKKRKPMGWKILEEVFDVIEDIFD